MKVDYLSIYFKTSTIPSRTKHEAFKSFGSRAQLLQLFMRNSHFFFEYNEPILSSLFIFHIQKKKISKRIINPRPEYSEDSSEQTNNCQQRCFFFFFKSKEFFLIYT